MLVLLSSRASLRPTIIACLRKHGVARPERRRSAWIVRNRSWTGCNGRTMAAAHAAPGCARSRRCRCGRYDARAPSLPRPGTPRPRRASAGRPSAASPSAGASAEPGWRRVDRKTHDASPSVGAARLSQRDGGSRARLDVSTAYGDASKTSRARKASVRSRAESRRPVRLERAARQRRGAGHDGPFPADASADAVRQPAGHTSAIARTRRSSGPLLPAKQ